MNHTNADNDICYSKVIDPANMWGNTPPLVKAVPQLVLQIAVGLTVNQGLHIIFQCLHQPRIISDTLTALILSPSTLNKIHHTLGELIVPKESFLILRIVGNLGLLYTMFIHGLHADLTPITQRTTKIFSLACSSFVLPFGVGCYLYLAFLRFTPKQENIQNVEVVSIYWGIITTATSFPTLAPILAKLKLLCTDIGRDALSVGLFNDVFTFMLIIYMLALSATSPDSYHYIDSPTMLWVILFMILYMLLCTFVVKPIFSKIVAHRTENYMTDTTVQVILFMILACGVLTDFFGSHFIFGAFVLGTNIPSGIISETVIENLEDCVLGILMPLYFMSIGTKVDIVIFLTNFKYYWVILIAITSKVLCTLLSALFCKKSIREGFALGILLSTKGLLPLVILDIGLERGHLTEESFMMLLLILVISTIFVGPIASIGYKRIRNSDYLYVRRTLAGVNPTEELRLITCINTPQNVPSIINLLEISNITTQCPALVFALHVIELVGHASAMLIEHDYHKSIGHGPKFYFSRARYQSDHIIEAFREYEDQINATATVQVLTVISPIDTVHDEICSLAEDKQASLIILSFHKQQGADGMLEDMGIEFGAMNQNVLAMAPCSVGLLVDRGLRISSLSSSSLKMSTKSGNIQEETRIAMVYVGGPDDREALTYAWRMAGHPFVSLTVIRFVIGDSPIDVEYLENPDRNANNEGTGVLTKWTQNEKEKQMDDAFLNIFQQKTAHLESISYVEKVSNSGDETVSFLSEMHRDYHLYIVGRGQSMASPLTAGLSEWSECRELGLIGDVLATSDFTTNASVLVIQQYVSYVS